MKNYTSDYEKRENAAKCGEMTPHSKNAPSCTIAAPTRPMDESVQFQRPQTALCTLKMRRITTNLRRENSKITHFFTVFDIYMNKDEA